MEASPGRGEGHVDGLGEIDALVAAGRRAPGSDAERRAARHLELRLTELGRRAELEPIAVWPQWPLAYACCAALGVAGSVLSVSTPIAGAVLSFTGALLFFLDAALLIPTVRRGLGRRASQNVISWDDDADRPGALVLVAHYDAGRSGLALGAWARWRRGGLEPLFWTQVAVLVCCLLRLLGVSGVPFTVVQFVPTALLTVAIALLLDIALSGTRGGENDNASGVALALRLAERLTDRRLAHFALHLLFTGGQTAGSAGMRGFLRTHRHELDRERTVFLNLDEVGSGTVRYAKREGPLLALRTHAQLTGLCDAIAEDDEDGEAFGARPLAHRSTSDAYAARSAGLPALTITCRDDLDRTSPRVEEEAIERAEAFCAELIQRLDAEIGPELAG